MSTDLVRTNGGQALAAAQTLDETMTLGKTLAQSGYFQDAREAAQAVVKVLAGQELGFGPIASMTGVNIISGRVSLSANMIAAAVKRSGRYNYRVRRLDDQECSIEFYERAGADWQSVGVSTFTRADAVKAQTQNLAKFPRNMLFARAMSNGAKWFAADVFGGPVYTPDELGAVVDGDTGEMVQPGPSRPTPAPPPDAQTVQTSADKADRGRLNRALAAALKERGVDPADRARVRHLASKVIDGPVASLRELTLDQLGAVRDALNQMTAADVATFTAHYEEALRLAQEGAADAREATHEQPDAGVEPPVAAASALATDEEEDPFADTTIPVPPSALVDVPATPRNAQREGR